MTGPKKEPTPFGVELGRRLRAARAYHGLSLAGVRVRSGGRWSAIAIGSYERGDRSPSLERLAELAVFYDVPAASLLPAVDLPAGIALRRTVL